MTRADSVDRMGYRRWGERPGIVLAVVAFGMFVAADDLMVVSTMLRPMVDDLGLVLPDDLGDTAWIVNVYLIAYLAVMPLAGRISDVLGRRTVFVGGLALFALGSVVVPASDSLGVLLVGRALTAVGGGALVPVALAVAGDLHQGRNRARAIGVLGAVETLGWVWGPLYGAVLVRFASWRWQFHLNLPLALIGAIAAWAVLEPGRRVARRVDWAGAALLTVVLVAFGSAVLAGARIQGVGELSDLGGSDRSAPGGPWFWLVAVVALVALVLVERRSSAPMIDPSVFAGRASAAGLAVNALVGVGLVVALVNVPLFVNVVEGDTGSAAVRAGWLLTALTATMAAASYLGGRVAGRLGDRRVVVAGSVAGAVALIAMGATWTGATGAGWMAWQLALLGAGLGLVLAPTTAAVVDAAREEDRGVAAGLVIVARLVGFSLGLAGLTAWGLWRYQRLRDGQHLPPLGSPGAEVVLARAAVDLTTRALTGTFVGAGLALAVASGAALGLRGLPRHRS
jgi:MFS family permease